MTIETNNRSHYPIEDIDVPDIFVKPIELYSSLLWQLSEQIHTEVDISIETESQLRRHLENNGSILLLGNHESHVDNSVIYSRLVNPLQQAYPHLSVLFVAGNKLFPDYFPRTLTPDELQTNVQAIQQSLPKRLQYWFEGITMRMMARQKGIHLLPIIQGDQNIDDRLVAELAIHSLKTLKENLEKPQTVAYFSLEGGRSNTGKVLPAKTGLNRFIKSGANDDHIMYVPFGLQGTRNVLSKDLKLNLHAPVQLRVGTPYVAEEIRRDSDLYKLQRQDVMMLRIIELLPPQKWGYYCASQFKPYRLARHLPF